MGLVALFVGFQIDSRHGPINNVCHSGLGVLGQAVNSTAQSSCSTASNYTCLCYGLMILGLMFCLNAAPNLLGIRKRKSAF